MSRVRRSCRRSQGAIPQLTCELCRERKVKCDKLDPCTGCTSSEVTCVPIFRHRLPRGRYSNRSGHDPAVDAAASGTIKVHHDPTHLDMACDRSSTTATTARSASSDVITLDKTQCAVNIEPSRDLRGEEHRSIDPAELESGYIPDTCESLPQQDTTRAPEDFCDNFMTVAADELAPAVADPPDRDINTMDEQVFMSVQSLEWCQLPDILPPASSPRPKQDYTRRLCLVYLLHVDPVIKVLHRSTVREWLVDGNASYLGRAPNDLSLTALRAAVCYIASCSMTKAHCQTVLQEDKDVINTRWQLECELAFDHASLTTSQDVCLLQAFTLYLVGRLADHGRDDNDAVWALIALAVRLAKRARLHEFSPLVLGSRPGLSFFEQQTRARLWLTICSIDLRQARAHNTDPLIQSGEVRAALDAIQHLDDADFDPRTADEPLESEEINTSTFALVTYHAQLAGRLLIESGTNPAARRDHAHQFETTVLGLLKFCDIEQSPYAWFTWHSTQSLIASMRAATLQSPHSSRTCGFEDPRPTQLLRNAVQVLEKHRLVHTDPRGLTYRWYSIMPASILTTAANECMTCNDTRLVQAVWPMIESCFEHYETVASGHSADEHLLAVFRRTRKSLVVRKIIEPPISFTDRSATSLDHLQPKTTENMSVKTNTLQPSSSIMDLEQSPELRAWDIFQVPSHRQNINSTTMSQSGPGQGAGIPWADSAIDLSTMGLATPASSHSDQRPQPGLAEDWDIASWLANLAAAAT